MEKFKKKLESGDEELNSVEAVGTAIDLPTTVGKLKAQLRNLGPDYNDKCRIGISGDGEVLIVYLA